MLFAFVMLGLVSTVLRQEIDWEERLQNDLFYVEWDVIKTLTHSINQSMDTHPTVFTAVCQSVCLSVC